LLEALNAGETDPVKLAKYAVAVNRLIKRLGAQRGGQSSGMKTAYMFLSSNSSSALHSITAHRRTTAGGHCSCEGCCFGVESAC